MDDDKDVEESEERDEDKAVQDSDNLRELILEQLANLEQSDVSDDGSYKARLSCILEDDENDSSGALQRDNRRNVERSRETEKGPSDGEGKRRSDSSETSEDNASLTVRTTTDGDKVDGTGSDGSDEFPGEGDAFAIKKLKSSDNVHRRPVAIRSKREVSSDSSDFDISVTNSTEGPPAEVKADVKKSAAGQESETSIEEDSEMKHLDVLDNERLASIFAKVSKTYLEKTKGPVEWKENETIDRTYGTVLGERSRSGERHLPEDHLSLQDAHIRGTSPKQYNPPVPPETYLWEELKRLRERGGYPWTYLDKPPFDEATWKKYMDHVYEPINPLPQPRPVTQSPEELDGPSSKSSSIPGVDHRVPPIPSENDVPKTGKDALDVVATQSDDLELEETALETHAGFSTEQTTSGTNVASPKVSKGILKWTGPMEVPIKHPNLGTTRREQMRAQAQDIQEKLRNHAGRIRTKFNIIQRSSFRRKKKSQDEGGGAEAAAAEEDDEEGRPKTGAVEDRPKFRMPDLHAPKLTFPDRGKFKFPEKAKFHLPQSAKIHLPDRSKFHVPESARFHLPERPKFNLTERIHLPDTSKLHLPERPKLSVPKLPKIPDKAKLHLPDRAKIRLPDRAKLRMPDRSKLRLPDRSKLHLPDRSKFHLPEKAKLHLPDRSKFHLPEKAKFHLPDRSKFHLPERAKLEMAKFKRSKNVPESPSTSSGSKFDLKSYPKLFSKHSKDYVTSSPKQTREQPTATSPVERQQKAPVKPAVRETDDLQYMDDDSKYLDKNDYLFDYRDKDFQFEEDDPEDISDEVSRSTGCRLPDNIREFREYDRKKGVLEEINSDEYFLRQKGISQDDIDMGKYLSHEIREAFRSPDVNALAKMDYVADENVQPTYRVQPVRPKRAGTTKKFAMKKTSSDPSVADDGYKTYPPRRPGRKSRSQSKSLLNEDNATTVEDAGPPYDSQQDADVNVSRYDNMDVDEDNVSEYYKTPGPVKEYEHYKIPRSHELTRERSPTPKRSRDIRDTWNEFEAMMDPPVPMTRKKSQKKKKKKQNGEEDAVEDLQSTADFELEKTQQVAAKSEEFLHRDHHADSPVPPKRTRSSGSRSFITEGEEEEISRSFHSEPEKSKVNDDEDVQEQVEKETSHGRSDPVLYPPGDSGRPEITDLDDVGFGYATVGKPTATKPQRQKKKDKPERPPPPRRKKDPCVPVYNTYPRRVPVRPLRNYSTLGPCRPPRRVKPLSRIQSEKPFNPYADVESEIVRDTRASTEVSGSGKDLQTEQVIEKMKGRPLPPPPRPPRQKSKGPDDAEPTEEEQIALSILRDVEFPLGRPATAYACESSAERQFVEEVCTSTQTDALPDDLSFVTDDSLGQEFGRDQLTIQQAFLDEMKREEEESRRRGESDELKSEVIRQVEDIIAEERRKQDDRKTTPTPVPEAHDQQSPKKADSTGLDAEDMGYASLERRGQRQQTATSHTDQLPARMEKLQVRELEAELINVREVQSDQIFVKELQSNRVASPDIDNTGGHLVLGSVDLPPGLIDQIVAKIPWETLRTPQQSARRSRSPTPPPVRPQRRTRDVDLPEDAGVRTSHGRRHQRRQRSGDDEDVRERGKSNGEAIGDLSLRLAKACTAAGVETVRNFVNANAAVARSLDVETCVQVVLCIAVALIAAFFLFGLDAKIIHLHRWDFQFPPQPPTGGI